MAKAKKSGSQRSNGSGAAGARRAATMKEAAAKKSADAAESVESEVKSNKDAQQAAKDISEKAEDQVEARRKAVEKKVTFDSAAKPDKKAEKKAETKKPKNKKPNIFVRLKNYLDDVKAEMKRVTWPTKQDVLHSSLIVIGALVFFGLLIFLVDWGMVPLLDLYSNLAAMIG